MFTISNLRLMTAQHVLSEMGITSFVINKMDSAHAGIFGEIELHVPASDAERARSILLEEEIINL